MKIHLLTLKKWIESTLAQWNLAEDIIPYISVLILFVLSIIFAIVIVYIAKVVLRLLFFRVSLKAENQWDNLLVKHKFVEAVSLIFSVIIFKISVPLIFEYTPSILDFMVKMVDVYLVIVFFRILNSILKATEETLILTKIYQDKPIASYFQLLRILLIIVVFILGLSILMSKSPVYFLSAFGALSAILLLIFKDTILGLVASIQISQHDMIRIGDWIDMPKYDANGTVLSINLNTVKVSNWDKTVTTVPTYYFATESFKNWRGMYNSGGRRIRREIKISVNSIRFVDKELRERLMNVQLVSNYLIERQNEIEEHNLSENINTNVLINGRRMTNIGVFREYILQYLKNNPHIHQEMSIMVRQLTQSEFGLPLQIYCFTNSTAWAEYEQIQSDIFDHLFAAASFFDLEIYQKPTGMDFQNIAIRK